MATPALPIRPSNTQKIRLPKAYAPSPSIKLANELVIEYQRTQASDPLEAIQNKFKFNLPNGSIDKATIDGISLSEVMNALPSGSPLANDIDLIFATKLQIAEFKNMTAEDMLGTQTAAEYRDDFSAFTRVKLSFTGETKPSAQSTIKSHFLSTPMAGMNECFLNTALKALELPALTTFYLQEIQKALSTLTGDNQKFAEKLQEYLQQMQQSTASAAAKRDVVNAFYDAYEGTEVKRNEQNDTVQFLRAISDILGIKPLQITTHTTARTDGAKDASKTESYAVMSLPGNTNLQAALNDYLSPETIQVGRGTAQRNLGTNQPPVLLVQLNETLLQSGHQRTRVINGQPYGLPRTLTGSTVTLGGKKYAIEAVFDHSGDKNAGHYELRKPGQRVTGHITGLILVAK